MIWKGIDSNTISGLKILDLPPITKPKMRVQETTIDGLDGSVFEELGYQSYDKSIKIGLVGDYDIDEVISYFTGEGNVIFDNEEDKYYKARIIEKIDYDRLIRYRTATVKFRVQPFKYNDEKKTVNITSGVTSVNVYNTGNIESKPIIKITGSGTIEFKQETVTIFSYTFPTGDTYVVIDSDKQDAYVGSTLKNRSMDGEFPIFKTGRNTITWTGTITKIEINNHNRWL